MTDLMAYCAARDALEMLLCIFREYQKLLIEVAFMLTETPEKEEELRQLADDYGDIASELLYTRRELVGRSDNGVPREEMARILKDGIDRMLKTGEGRTG